MKQVRPAKRFFAPDTVLIIGHRGYSGRYPENTLLAFSKALEHGALGCEIDIRMSKDGVIVVIHDATVDRTTNGTGRVSDLTWDELRTLDAGVKFSPEFAGREDCGIPRLSDVFDALSDTNAIFELDMKDFNAISPAAEMAKARGLEERVFFVGSESHAHYVAANHPEFVSYRGLPYSDIQHHIRNARGHGHEVISWSVDGIDNSISSAVHEANRLLRASTLTRDDPETMNRMAEFGVNLFLTDWVETMVDVLADRGIKQQFAPAGLRLKKRMVAQ